MEKGTWGCYAKGGGLFGMEELYGNMLRDCDMGLVTFYKECIVTGKL